MPHISAHHFSMREESHEQDHTDGRGEEAGGLEEAFLGCALFETRFTGRSATGPEGTFSDGSRLIALLSAAKDATGRAAVLLAEAVRLQESPPPAAGPWWRRPALVACRQPAQLSLLHLTEQQRRAARQLQPPRLGQRGWQ